MALNWNILRYIYITYAITGKYLIIYNNIPLK